MLSSCASTFVVTRNGASVTATERGQALTGDEWKDLKDPSAALAVFFASYFSQSDEWKDMVANGGFSWSGCYAETHEEMIAAMTEAYEDFYGLADSISITIKPAKFKSNGDGSAFYTIKIALSYRGESDEGEDTVTMLQDENGNWLVVELPM